jgi:hypothetical protein
MLTTAVKVAVTVELAATVTLHAPVPEQAPLQPAKVLPLTGVSVNVTTVFGAKLAVQLPLVQLIPAGLLTTVPCPVPASVTVKATLAAVKVAVTAELAASVTLHAPIPEQAPLQPAKALPPVAVSVNVTTVFGA